MLEPLNVLAIQRFLNGNVRHRDGCCCAMPMLQAGRKSDHIARTHFLDRSALALNPSQAGRDDQPLRVRMPSGARTRLEGDAGGADAPGLRRLK
jgi:hypothetical protein